MVLAVLCRPLWFSVILLMRLGKLPYDLVPLLHRRSRTRILQAARAMSLLSRRRGFGDSGTLGNGGKSAFEANSNNSESESWTIDKVRNERVAVGNPTSPDFNLRGFFSLDALPVHFVLIQFTRSFLSEARNRGVRAVRDCQELSCSDREYAEETESS